MLRTRKIKQPKKSKKTIHNYLKKTVVKKNYGFEYDNNFRKMLIGLIGLINVEKLEKKVDPVKFSQLKSILNSLKEQRNAQAHTHIKGVMQTIDAPSVTQNNFEKVYAGLKDVEKQLKKMGF